MPDKNDWTYFSTSADIFRQPDLTNLMQKIVNNE